MPNRTAYAKQQPPLRPRATEDSVDIYFSFHFGVAVGGLDTVVFVEDYYES